MLLSVSCLSKKQNNCCYGRHGAEKHFFFGLNFPHRLNHSQYSVQLVAVDEVGVVNEETCVFLFYYVLRKYSVFCQVNVLRGG